MPHPGIPARHRSNRTLWSRASVRRVRATALSQYRQALKLVPTLSPLTISVVDGLGHLLSSTFGGTMSESEDYTTNMWNVLWGPGDVRACEGV